MRFVRRRIPHQSRHILRTIAARDGWLVESPDALRAGFGGLALSVELQNIEGPTNALAELRRCDVSGDEGPAGTGIVAFGSLPFDRDAPGRLDVARYCVTQFKDGPTWLTTLEGVDDFVSLLANVIPADQETQDVRSVTYQPTPERYAHNVALAVEILRRKEIDKVVLARAVLGSVPEPIDAASVAQRLHHREPACTVYSVPTSDARRFVGASPELLARREGADILCYPLAGTIALPSNVAPDDYQNWLLGSTKNLHEHAVLVDDLVKTLSQYYDDINADATPSIVSLRTIAHLGTRIQGHATRENVPDALDVLRLLHPTAAVGGIPHRNAYELICRLEQHDRGHYAGPVGWLDANGDGEWWIGIRGVLLAGTEFEAWAGAGIVSESDPIAEREETRVKLAVALSSILTDQV